MNILRKSNEIPGNYNIRGFHSTVCPVVLPSWIEHDVVVQLVKAFEAYLVEELELLQDPPSSLPTGPRHGHSGSSTSIWSMLSQISGETDGHELMNVTFPSPRP
jgi:hypothetical protein